MSSFETLLANADGWENEVKAWLEQDGWQVIHLAHLPPQDGHGPRAQGDGDPTLPDLQATKHGKSIAVEVKYKTRADGGRLSGKLEHGIDRPDYDGYLRYDHRTMPTFLILAELTPVLSFLGARVCHLSVRSSGINDRTPMVYWTRDQMVEGWPRILQMLNQHVYQSSWKQAQNLRAEQPPPPAQGELFS